MSDLLVLHALGDPEGGAPWAGAFRAAGWPGAVHTPDLPGHAGREPPLGGGYHRADPALFGALVLAEGAVESAVVVGVGPSGWGAELLALGSRAVALVLVDGLGGPWLDAPAAVEAERAWVRRLADDPAALAPAPAGGRLDPRLGHGVPGQTDRGLALRAAGAVSVPVLVVETAGPGPALLSPGETEEVVAAFPAAELVRLEGASPAAVADAVTKWAAVTLPA
ncbi:MAG TPA: hypothetical protein VFW24_06110 [Acidimicrobiales bacterium]|nr:hypothetical protein [Acidimicrobiales bacterium]